MKKNSEIKAFLLQCMRHLDCSYLPNTSFSKEHKQNKSLCTYIHNKLIHYSQLQQHWAQTELQAMLLCISYVLAFSLGGLYKSIKTAFKLHQRQFLFVES
ncbi:hypothetical protein XELAEV_18012236mg [Xenopus laevis]|uniref:Uncharacterized protein n=1 Tax=Xenopus laevis TaxID=8355 RepID=A0A974HYI5_XENLA|nr:hypothetical protein XELAEV_18012236mg [Xenopus laevis]